jgi:hypothetical protein
MLARMAPQSLLRILQNWKWKGFCKAEVIVEIQPANHPFKDPSLLPAGRAQLFAPY